MALPPTSPVLEDSDESGSPVFADDPEYDWVSANEYVELDSPLESLGSPISDRYTSFDYGIAPWDEPHSPMSSVEKYQRPFDEILTRAPFRAPTHSSSGTPRTGMGWW